MTPIEKQIKDFQETSGYEGAIAKRLPSSAYLIEVQKVKLPPGWNQNEVTVLFLAPPGYPAAQPDCFWTEPGGLRLQDGTTPQNSNDSNPIPEVGHRGTWFSWHLQSWDPNRDSLKTYFNVILQRLNPPR